MKIIRNHTNEELMRTKDSRFLKIAKNNILIKIIPN